MLIHMALTTGPANRDLGMPTPRVPIEIVLRILDFASAPSLDLKLLRSCSLVCKAWSTRAQKMLFHSVSISTHREYTALVGALEPLALGGDTGTKVLHKSRPVKPSLASLTGMPKFLPTFDFTNSGTLRGSVIELNVIVDFNQSDCLTFAKLSHVISLCPNLRKIGISVFGMQPQGPDIEWEADQWRMKRFTPPISGEVLEKLRTSPNASRISELRLHDWSDDSRILIQLLGVWPYITSLKVAGKLPTSHSADFTFPAILPEAAPCALETLSLNCNTGTEASVDFVKWLLARSQQTLRRLEFLKEPSAKLLEDIFAHSMFSLDSVSLPSCTCPVIGQAVRDRLGPTFAQISGGNGEVDGAIPSLQVKGLKEVFVEDPSTPFKFLASVVQSGAVQKFGFGVDSRTDLSSLARVIKARTGLKRVAVWLCNGGERNFGLGNLRVACAIQGIELEETREIREFRAQKD